MRTTRRHPRPSSPEYWDCQQRALSVRFWWLNYAFLIDEDDFDAIIERIRTEGLDYWADPRKLRPAEINTNDGGRGVYFEDPNGHLLEVLTRPYGSGSSTQVRDV